MRQFFLDINFKDFNKVMNTNYYSAFNIFRKIYPMLKNSEFARIINLTSIFSTRTMPKRTSYSASKSALDVDKKLSLRVSKKFYCKLDISWPFSYRNKSSSVK